MDNLGWKESPTQYAKIKGKDIEEKDFECSCDGSWGTGDNQEQFFKKRTIYPFNKVYHSESGHILEIDDNKESERISINHRTGSFVEFHPNGDRIDKTVRDSYASILRDSRLHVSGYSEITVDKSLKILVNAGENENTEEKSTNFDIHVGKNANINIFIEKGDVNITVEDGNTNTLVKKGDVNIRQEDGNYKHYVNGDYRLHVTGNHETFIGKNELKHIQGSRATSIGGVLDYLQMYNRNAHLETIGNKESKIMKNNYYIYSDNFISRSKKQTIIETSDPNLGNLTISSSANMSIASGWNPVSRGKSSNPDPKMYFFAYKNPKTNKGGEFWFSADKHFNLLTKEKVFFDIQGDEFHVLCGKLKKNWEENDGPQVQNLQILTVFSNNINYDDIIKNGFKTIKI